jgi:SNF2 family DNA or RNA helicase
VLSKSAEFFVIAARLARHLLAMERFVPMLRQGAGGELEGAWQPWLGDEPTVERVTGLVRAMPASARAVVDEHGHEPWAIVEDYLNHLVDSACRRVMIAETIAEAIESRDPSSDTHVAWLTGLVRADPAVLVTGETRSALVKGVRQWISLLDERGRDSAWRLCFRLEEPSDLGDLGEFEPPGDEITWRLSFHLRSMTDRRVLLDASDIWLLPTDSLSVEGEFVERPQELLSGELARASRVYRRLEESLDESEPVELSLSTKEAYEFLRDVKPILEEQGFEVEAPGWWDSPSARLGARLKLWSDEDESDGEAGGSSGAVRSQIGIGALVNYQWRIAVGETVLTLGEFERLAERRAPLVRVGGQWVEIRPEDVRSALHFLRENPGGTSRLADALRLAYGADMRETGIPVTGVDTSGWISLVLGETEARERLPSIEPPRGFAGTLRPYQLTGLSWLVFLERFGMGACLADDMGLGKTIQVLALLQYEREQLGDDLDPTLLVVPMSVVANWVHEAHRFTPALKFLVHHGPERLRGANLARAAEEYDAIVTTYALAYRDREEFESIRWRRIVLDEAQFIKNPSAKITRTLRSFLADRRIALTGTPVENRLTELWSIMEFLNPGFLGPAATFRRRFSVPIERYHDVARSQQLRGLIQPFLLRRLKSDTRVLTDLPEKVEGREYSHLSSEQAELYESLVSRMLGQVDRLEGMHRRGVVLSTLVKLKQICNHPSQYLKDHDFGGLTPPTVRRSGKSIRLVEMLGEILDADDQALIFTQFRQMGHLLVAMLRHELDREVLFLHGGSTKKQRDAMVKTFQKRDGSCPIFVVSLKAGGVGLNLTAANHVFHYDRWWNPAVENQATDRAHRIGQTRTVQVHKFVVAGTLEERIDRMLQEKSSLAEKIIGSGERWLTDLSTDQLRELVTLRREALVGET